MFEKLFKRKAEVVTTEPPIVNLATLLILTMSQELSKAEAEAQQQFSPPSISEVRASYDKLFKLGLGSTQNALLFKKQIDEYDKRKEDCIKAQELVRFIKAARCHFGPNTVLVSHTAFGKLCAEYNLTTGLLSDYTGVIPERNVQELSHAVAAIASFPYRNMLNKFSKETNNTYFLKVNWMSIHPDDKNIEKYINDHNCIIEVKRSSPNYDGSWWVDDIVGLEKGIHYRWNALSHISGKILNSSMMFIACPKKYLNNPEVKVTSLPVDPVVFQYTPYGVLIHTVWGEEAEDAALKEFMKFNSRMAQSSL